MADIELVIKIPEEVYKAIKKNGYTYRDLPKGHGRLIDADEVIKIANKTKDLHGAIWNATTIIEADEAESEVQDEDSN